MPGRSRARRSSAPVPVPTSPGVLTLKLDSDVPLQVMVVSKEQPPKPLRRGLKWLVFVVFLLGALWLILHGIYLLPRTYTGRLAIPGTSLSAALAHPTYVAFGDEAELDVTITNQDPDDFSGFVVIVFTGTIMPMPLPAETTRLDIKDLAGHASKSYRLKFVLAASPQWRSGESVRVSLAASSQKQLFSLATETTIWVAPLPYMRTAHAALSGSAMVAAVAALLWEVIRKRLFGWEAK